MSLLRMAGPAAASGEQWAMSFDFVAIAVTVLLAVIVAGSAFTVYLVTSAHKFAGDVRQELRKPDGKLPMFIQICTLSLYFVAIPGMVLNWLFHILATTYLVEEMVAWAGKKEGTAGDEPVLVQAVLWEIDKTMTILFGEVVGRLFLAVLDRAWQSLLAKRRSRREAEPAQEESQEESESTRRPPRGAADPVGRALRALGRGSRRSSGAPADSGTEPESAGSSSAS
ncbi:hypothetical protein [Streptomyces flaveolus]|uniref:hypothetical protein n=1 Tax=Streptomyces flaveolus TaxID=67297 RepID=UPI00331E535F